MKLITLTFSIIIFTSLASGKRLFCNFDNSICVDSDLLDSTNSTIYNPTNNLNATSAMFVQFVVSASSRLRWWAFGINQGDAQGMDKLEIYSFELRGDQVNFTLRYAETTKLPYTLSPIDQISVFYSALRQPIPSLPEIPGTPVSSPPTSPVTQFIATIIRPITFSNLFSGTIPGSTESVVIEFQSLSDWKTKKRNVAWAMGMEDFSYHGEQNRGFLTGLDLF